MSTDPARNESRSMIRGIIFKFFSAFSNPTKNFGEVEREALIEAQKNIKLKGSMQERLRATQEWSRSDAIIKRIEEQRVQASGALERAQAIKDMLADMSKEDYSDYNKYLVNRPDKAWRVK